MRSDGDDDDEQEADPDGGKIDRKLIDRNSEVHSWSSQWHGLEFGGDSWREVENDFSAGLIYDFWKRFYGILRVGNGDFLGSTCDLAFLRVMM